MQYDEQLEGRIAIVTGASAGIGEAIAIDLARGGAKVVINARRGDRLEALAARIGVDRAAVVAGDGTETATIDRMLDIAVERFGRDADLVVVNAGRGLAGGVYDSDPATWESLITLNLLGCARLLRAASERMIGRAGTASPAAPPADWPKRARDIVILGSVVGRHVSPFSSMYGSTKAGVHMLAESLRRVCGPRGVRVSLIEPAVVKSEFQDSAGYDRANFGTFMASIAPVLEPDDIARLVRFIVGQPAGVHVNDVVVRPTRQEYP